MKQRGRYIVFEGSDGVGKGTQMKLAVEESRRRDIPTLATREPGDSSIGSAVRKILLDPHSGDIHPLAEGSLYLADRTQLWFGKLASALDAGMTVFSDRNYWSEVAYQGFGGQQDVNKILQKHRLVLPERYLSPDIGLVFYLSEEARTARKATAGNEEFGTLDRMEQKQDVFFQRVEQGYGYVMQQLGGTGVDASGTIEEVTAQWWRRVFPDEQPQLF